MKIQHILPALATAAITLLLSACTGEADEPEFDASLCPITHIQVNNPGATRDAIPGTGSDGRPVTQFAAGDLINIIAYPGIAGQSSVSTFAYATDPKGDGNLVWTLAGASLYVHLTGDKGIEATYTPCPDNVMTPDQGCSVYYDHLEATAIAADGTIVAGYVTLNFKHSYSVVQIESIKDDGGTDIDPAQIAGIELFITDLAGQSRKIDIWRSHSLGEDIIVPNSATLNSLRITDSYGQVSTAPFPAGTSATQSGSRYPLSVTLHPHNATVVVYDITPWGEEEVVTPPDPGTKPIISGYDYVVVTADDLIALRDAVNISGNLPGTSIWARGARVIQIDDITLPAGTEWVPIGNGSYPFTGTYNGNGYTISGLQTANDYDGQYVGLFGMVSGDTANSPAVLTGIHLRGCTIIGTNTYGSFGALAGETENTVISNCSSTGSVTGNNSTGGLVGYAGSNSYITRSRSSCTVTGTTYAGGLVGVAYEAYITACTASGTVTGFTYAGGLAGRNKNSTIACCYAIGKVMATDPTDGMAGGLVGRNVTTATISHCYATGNATAINAGTFAGVNSATITLCHASGKEPAGVPVGETDLGAASDVSTVSGQAGTTVRTATDGTALYTFATKTVRTTGFDVTVEDYTFLPTTVWTAGDEPTINYQLQ